MKPYDPTITKRRREERLVRYGALSLLIGVLLILAPLLLGRGMLNKYIVTLGFLGACLGLALLLNGLIDHFFNRR